VKKRNTDGEEKKEFLVALTDAVVDPRTVMIHLANTPLTYTAVMTENTTVG